MTLDDLDAALARYPEGLAGRVILARAIMQVALHTRHYVRVYLGTSGYLTDTMQRFRAGERSFEDLGFATLRVLEILGLPDYRTHRLVRCGVVTQTEVSALTALAHCATALMVLRAGHEDRAREPLFNAIQAVGRAAAADACERRGVPDRAEASRIAAHAECLGLLERELDVRRVA